VHEVFLGLGSNLGERESLLQRACNEIERLIGPLTGRSAFLESEPWGFESQHPFLNAVVRCRTELEPLQVLDRTQQIEGMLGKRTEHHTKRDDGQHATYHDRPIDIDILLYDRRTICLPRLTVPHPLMKQRDFVIKPLLEVLCRNGDEEYLRFLNLLSTQYLHN
jgi:2-amino-4-hydroxy-6-hydroxymethyldihydropteridine diphosphokinase